MPIENEVTAKWGGHIYQVNPPMTREEMADMRKRCGLVPATFHYQDPTPDMQTDALWNAIWNEIKTWDINVPTEYQGYCGATGNHATAIYLAVREHIERQITQVAEQIAPRFVAKENE
jgi:hypothetical protein